jgi:hypothetical protein
MCCRHRWAYLTLRQQSAAEPRSAEEEAEEAGVSAQTALTQEAVEKRLTGNEGPRAGAPAVDVKSNHLYHRATAGQHLHLCVFGCC